ncbi:MAG: hypothetical protein M1594_00945, partial [Candidatus Marsarchaeota archaeon]|nr:hypothetical protein [Candidatus Marsarchaeota archaeon]
MDKEVVVFATIIGVIVIAIAAIIDFNIPLQIVIAAIILLIIISVLFPAWIEFKEYERGVVFRVGKFNRITGPGL